MTDAHRGLGADANAAPGTADGVAAALLAFAAFAVRALTWPTVFASQGLRLAGPDAHYHLRRILWSVESFPAALGRDPYLRFPDGGEAIWSPAFDLAIASVARPLAGRGNPAGVETVAVWVPPVLGALCVALLYFVARRFFGRRVAIAAAAFLALLPPHVAYSQIGFVDHHAAVALLATILLGATLEVVRDPPSAGFGASALLGLAMGAALLVWPGALLHVATAQACLLAWIGIADTPELATRRAARASVAHGAAFLLVAPFCIGRTWAAWGGVSPVVLSAFQPLWLGLPAIGLGACSLAWRGGIASARRAERAFALAGALGVLAVACLLAPEVRRGIASAGRWLFRSEPFQAVVAESLPLFSDGRGFYAGRAHAKLTVLVWLLPLAVAVVGLPWRRSRFHRIVAFWCATLFAATLAQYRFANSLSVAWALTAACSLDLGWRALRRYAPLPRRSIASAVLLVLAAASAPVLSSHAIALGTALRALAGERVRPGERIAHRDALRDAARWLRAHSPTTAGWLPASDGSEPPAPAYGVLTAWGDGHIVRYLAQRPVVQDNFGDDLGPERFDEAEAYYASTRESDALRIAADLRVRYVLVRSSGSGHPPTPYSPDSMLARLYHARGSAPRPDAGGLPTRALPALARHRLVYESPDAAGEDGGRYKIFEIVDGAVVDGRAAPGEVVEARLSLREVPGGRGFEYRAAVRAGADGRYSLRLPYPTEPFESRFQPVGLYRLSSAGRARALSVRESEVRAGARREGPDLAP